MTVTLELRVTHTAAEKDAVVLKLVRILAKQLLAQCAMLQDMAPPELIIECGDFYSATQEVKLFDEDGAEFDTDIIEAIGRFASSTHGINRIVVNAPKREETDE